MTPTSNLPGSEVVAPSIAQVLRRIVAARGIDKFAQTQIARLARIKDVSQVTRWWNGTKRLGEGNRRKLAAAFPEFANDITAAVEADLKLARESVRREAKRIGVDPAAGFDPELLHALADLVANAPQDEVAAVLTQMVEVGWKRLLPFLNDLLHRLMQLRVVVEGRESGAAEKA